LVLCLLSGHGPGNSGRAWESVWCIASGNIFEAEAVWRNFIAGDLFGTAVTSVKLRVQLVQTGTCLAVLVECHEGMRMRFSSLLSLAVCLMMSAAALSISGCSSATNSEAPPVAVDPDVSEKLNPAANVGDPSAESLSEVVPDVPAAPKQQTATFGAGCFWCVEAVFEQLKSVENVRSGYAGGKSEEATYDLVSFGNTGHAEVIQFEFDPSVITYEELLEVFWTSHDPTTLNRQGADVGTQYRSAVFYHNEEQRRLAEEFKQRLNDENAFGSPVVTQIEKFDGFYTAEKKHQDFFAQNGSNQYCQFVIRPKVEKVRKVFADKLR
jgi:peptide-methionine (S)-S-oxide reductase